MATLEIKQADIVSDVSRAIVNRWALMVNNPLSSVYTLEYIAREHRCDIEFCADATSSYMPDESEDCPLGIALINPNAPVLYVVRRIAHELAHHVLYWWYPLRYPYIHSEIVAAWGTSRELQEKICLGVSDLIMAAPFGFQPNGKQAIPRGDGFVLRIYNTQLAEWERRRGQKNV